MTTPNTYRWWMAALCGAALVAGAVFSQTSDGDPPENDIGGNDSPAGVTSGINGWVNTGCAYDSYTGNVRREVDEIVVPGSIGAYPLKWSRIYNSREAETTTALGVGWQHSYQYTMSLDTGDDVSFPDGREIDFNERSGISERLGGPGVVLLADGGQLIFEGVPYNIPGSQHTRFRLSRIVDPHGQATVMGYDSTETDQYGNAHYRLARVTEPGGRYLKINYVDASDTSNIASVEAYDSQNNVNQRVSYTYTPFTSTGSSHASSTLTRADYSDGTGARYTYQNDNSSRRGSPGIPLLKTCNDVRYNGAMAQIEYLFVAGDQIHGKIKSEKKPGTGEAVSTILFPSGRAAQTRVETRGDGPKRTFTYSNKGRLLSRTDFTNQATRSRSMSYDGAGFIGSVKDELNHETVYTREANIGQLTQLLNPEGGHVDLEYTDANNPYFLWRQSDERAAYVGDPQHSISYDRDPATHRVTQINYPDGATEGFSYNNFGEVTTHRRRNGAFDHFVYDSGGRLRKAWNPTATATWPPSDAEPHITIEYYSSGHPWADRVSTIYDQRQNSTAYEYDRDAAGQPCAGRGLVTKVTHVDGTYVSFAYDQLGNVIAQENELRQRTNFAYDDYSRATSITPPAPAQPISFTYEPTFGAPNPYLHTMSAVHLAIDGAGVTLERKYDQNFQVSSVIQVDGTDAPPTTTFDYWPTGLLRQVHDPRNVNWITSYTYTPRNQLETVTDALGHQTYRHHDPAGNVDYIDRPDTKRTTRTYDSMNRVETTIEPVTATINKTTAFTYWPSGKVHTITDDNNQTTTFTYDYSDRQQFMWYPDGTSYQKWGYDEAGNLNGHRTVGGKVQRFRPDNRNRITDMWWDPGNVPDWTHFDYDSANRLTRAQNQNGTVTRQYDDAGRLLSEAQNVDGLGAKTVTYASDGAGKRMALGIAGTDYQFAYHYDPLGRLDQLLSAENSSGTTSTSLWYQYTYDAASNQTQRYCPMNGVDQIYLRDALGRVQTLKIQKASQPQYTNVQPPPINAAGSSPVVPVPPLPKPLSLLAGLSNLTTATSQDIPIGTVLSSEDYAYDAMSRVTGVGRKGNHANGALNGDDHFDYDYSGQLIAATYTNWSGSTTRSVSYLQDNLGNRSQVNDNGNAQGYSGNGNYRNQYVSGPAGPVSNGSEHEVAGYQGINYSYIGDQRLASVSGNGSTYDLAYDAFGRCVKRALNGATIYYTYDGPHPIYEWKADGTKAGWNVYGQGIDEILLRADYTVISDGQGYFFQQNRLGSVTHLTGFAGEPIESYRYDGFGMANTYTLGNFNNRFRFTGREYQPSFGIYEYRNRAYHPGLGRFLSEDPSGFGAGDSNLFRYCGGDPVNRRDPFGLATQSSDAPGTTFKNDGTNSGPGVVVSDKYLHDQNTNPFDPTKAFFEGAMDWGPFDQVMQYLGGGDHQGGPSGDGGGRGSGIGRSFDSGVTEVTYGLEGVVVTFIWNPIDTLFWYGPGSPFGGLESSVFGGLVLNGYSNNALPTLGDGRSDSGSTGSASAARGNSFRAEFGKEYAKYDFPRIAKFWEGYARGVSLVVAGPTVGVRAVQLTGVYLAANRGEWQDFASELIGLPGETAMPTTGGGWLGFGWHRITGVGFADDGSWHWW